MATSGSLPVILKKLDRSLDPCSLKNAEVSEKCRVLATLGSDQTLKLLELRSDAQCALTSVKQFKWSLCQDCTNDSVQHDLSEDHFAAVKSDSSIEIYSISKSFEDLSVTCDAVVAKDLLKGLLHDRGKDWLGDEVDLVLVRRSTEPERHEVTLLLDMTFVAVLSVTKSTTAVSVCFDIKQSVKNIDIVRSGLVEVVQRCHQFIFTLLSNGVILIHNLSVFIVSVDIWMPDNFITQDYATIQPRPVFTHLEVADDLSFVVCTDEASNIYLINLDVYFEDFPSQLVSAGFRGHSSSVANIKFQYEPDDEDAVARVPHFSGITYGDRVWKTELLAFRGDAHKQACLSSISAKSPVCDFAEKNRWFSHLVGSEDGHLLGTFTSCNKQPLASSHRVSGFRAKQAEDIVTDARGETNPGCCQKLFFFRHEAWMEMFILDGIFITPASFLLNFKSKQLSETEEHSSELPHGLLCLFVFNTKEYVYHTLSESSLLVRSCETVYPPLLLTSKSLVVPAFDITQDQLVHKVIMYENAGLADSLCFANQWDHCTIPVHALEVALKLRQLDTIAFFLKNQDKAFTNRSTVATSSGSLLSGASLSPSSSQSELALGTTDVETVTEALVRAVKYNMRQQHYQHFTRQLAQMTLSYLHNLLEDGAKLLEAEDAHFSSSTVQSECTPFHQEINTCLEFLTQSTVELRCHLSNMPADERLDNADGNQMSFPCIKVEEADKLKTQWIHMTDEEIVEDAIINRQISSAQTFFQSRRKEDTSTVVLDVHCDGSLSSFIAIGLKIVLQKLLDHDMDTVVTLLMNLGRDVLQQLHKICMYTLHRPLRDFLTTELESRSFLSHEEKDLVAFVNTLETIYSQQSFIEAKRNTRNNEESDSWRDLGLLRSSFNLGSTQILDTYIQTGSLLKVATTKQAPSTSSRYVELPLAWGCAWDDLSRQRILAEAVFSCADGDYTCLSDEVRISAEAVWKYLLSHTNWETLLDWIRSMACDLEDSRHYSTLHVHEGNVVLPQLTRGVFSQLDDCHKVVKEMILEELTRHGMFTTSQLSNFSVLLHYLCITQTLFGDKPPITSLDNPRASEDTVSLNTEGCILSVLQFHQSFVDYCIRLKLANLLYYYMDFYRLCECESSVKELGLNTENPAWVDMLLKCRLLGRNPEDHDAVFQAGLSMASFVLNTESSSITHMLQTGRQVMALSSLLYGPNTLSQAIVSSIDSQPNIPVYQVDEKLLYTSLMRFPKVQSALFPITSGSLGMECQDISVYQLLQGNSPFEISRLFGWQPTNELATKGANSMSDMPHFSNELLVSQRAHVERLTFSYYLRHGRPSFAFVSFVSERLKDSTVSKPKIHQAAGKAYRVAVQHLSNPSVCAACVAFTEMLGLDSTSLRVDIQAASRVLAHAALQDLLSDVSDDTKEDTTLEDAVASELLSCAEKGNQKPERLLTALQCATRNLISRASSINGECLDKTSFEAAQQWNLVVLFCRVHNMELPVSYLQDCASEDKWLPFVCHAQVCQFPKDQVVRVIEHDFSNAHIQEHLQLAFDSVPIITLENAPTDESTRKRGRKRKSAKKQEQVVTPARDVRAQFYSRMGLIAASAPQPSQNATEDQVIIPVTSSSAEDEEISKQRAKLAKDKDLESSRRGYASAGRLANDCEENLLDAEEVPKNLFDILFKCQSVAVPWRKLLAYSISLHRSLLSVLAACFQDSKPLDCLCAWICSTVHPSVLEPALENISGSRQADSWNVQKLQWRQWTQEDLTALILALVDKREKLAHTLAKAFYIFDPESPLVNFFHFHEAFLVHSDFEACKEYLKAFKISYNKLSMKVVVDKSKNEIKIGDVDWLEKLTSQVTKQMLTSSESSYQQTHLLEILAKIMFGKNFSCQVPDYFELHEVCKVLHATGTGIRLNVMLASSVKDIEDEKQRVLLALLSDKHFAQARRFADMVGIADDQITLKEVEAELQGAKNSMLWEIEQGRLAFWHEAEKCFRNNNCKAGTIGSFFESQAEDQHLTFTERALLLGIAVKWFSNPTDGQQQKTPAELKELQKNRWLFKIRAEIEKDFEGRLARSVSHLEFLSHETEMELLSEIKPSNLDLVSCKVVNLTELVQDDDAVFRTDSDCPLSTDKEFLALENLIGNLLERCHVTQARWLANLFSHSCLELDVVMSCIHLAQGTRSVDTLDAHIQALLKPHKRASSSSSRPGSFHRTGSFVFTSPGDRHDSVSSVSSMSSVSWVEVEDIITTMESLTFHCKQAKRCCNCIIVCYKVAQTLGHEYEAIAKKKPLSVLQALLLSGFDNRYKLMDIYIKAIQINTDEVTQFLADIILNSLRVHCTGEDISGREYSELTVNAAPSCEDLSHMIRLCPDYSLLGSRLLEAASALVSDRATGGAPRLSLEVELLVRAHQCHTLACNMEGIATVLRNGRVLTSALAETGEYIPMVRLLTGVGRFNEMSYIFDTLFEHEHFELLCRKGIEKENKLKVALLDYLRRQHPDDTDKFSMVAHHFRMYREIAQTLEEAALKQLANLGDCFPERKSQGSTGKGAEDVLNSIMKSFCYASDSYAKENCWRHSQACLRMARLVHFQIWILPSGVTVVNLDAYSLKRFLATHADFFQALVVAEAYKKRDISVWVDAVYNQVIVKGNFNYLQDMRSALSVTNNLYIDVANKYKNENPRSSQAVANMKKLLEFVSDVRIRYKLATDLHFRDLGASILEVDGGAFLRDVMVP